MSTSPFAPGRMFQRADGLLMASVENELLMMGVDLGSYFHFNRIGSRIWELLETPKTLDQIVDSLTAQYDVAAETVRTEVTAFLVRLEEERLLRAAGDGAAMRPPRG